MPAAGSSTGCRVGVDLGGTKIEVIALDPVGSEVYRMRVPTPQDDYDAIVRSVADLSRAAERVVGRATVGVGIPGAISSKSGLVKNANTTCLIGRPFDRDLAGAIGRPVRVENDANCFALSEAVDGAGRDGRVVFGVILGTGVGGGVVVAQQIWHGRNRIAGEWGHNPLPGPTAEDLPLRACYCGRRGCIETYLCGPGVSRQYQELAGETLAALRIAQAAAQGQHTAEQVLKRFYDRLARGLAMVINCLDPDVVVLGGGLSNLPGLAEHVTVRLPAHVFSDRVDTAVRTALHGDSSGVRGAAWLWPAQERP